MVNKEIRTSTLVGLSRFGMYQEYFKDYTIGCEVGVDKGRNARQLCIALPSLKKLVLVDPYQHENRVKYSQGRLDSIKRQSKRQVHEYPVEWKYTTSLEASRDIKDGSLDFVYIDGDHRFSFVMLDILLWSAKVRPGGVVSGHDYGIPDVNTAVHAYAYHNRKEVFLTDARVERKNIPMDRKLMRRSWMFYK